MSGQQFGAGPLRQARFDVNDADCEVARATVRQVLQDLDGVREVQFLGAGALVTYNPLGVTTEEICTAITQIGYRVLLSERARIRIRKSTKRR